VELFSNGASPYVRKVLIVLHETDQLDDVTLTQAMGTALDSSNMPLAHNPIGKVPTLVRDDGPALYDSRVICRYLDDRAGAGLYGHANALWDSLTIEATADGILDALVLMTTEAKVRPPELHFGPWLDGQWAKVERAIQVLETRWLSHLHGPFGMSQIAVASALGYADFRHAGRDWRAKAPGLARWFADISERPSLQATAPAL